VVNASDAEALRLQAGDERTGIDFVVASDQPTLPAVQMVRLAQNPELSQWWDKEQASSRGNEEWDKVISKIAEFGAQLGDEIVVTAQLSKSGKGEPDGPLVLTTVKDPSGFGSYIEGQISTLSVNAKKAPGIRFVDDPMSEVKTSGDGTSADLFVWINGDVLAASPKLEFLQRVQKEPAYQTIPVIIISTEGKEEDTIRGLKMGAKGYVKKPFQASELHGLIEKITAE